MAPRQLELIGAATSAGAHHAGQEQAPAALRAAGLADRLRSGGRQVTDAGDAAKSTFVVDHGSPGARNLPEVVRVASLVRDAVDRSLRAGSLPVIMGGDCTITLGVVAAAQRHEPEVALLYFDGDADLATPADTESGILDAMGVAHLLGLADTELARLDGRYPMLTDPRLAMIGYAEGDPSTFRPEVLTGRTRLIRYPDAAVRADPAGTARAAVQALGQSARGIVLHFDVDAVDSGDLPLGNFPHYGTGVPLDAASAALHEICATANLAAIVLTEINPSYDPSGGQLARYVDAVGGAIAGGLQRNPLLA